MLCRADLGRLSPNYTPMPVCTDRLLLRLGVPDHFVEHGSQAILRDSVDLSPAGIVRQIMAHFPPLATRKQGR